MSTYRNNPPSIPQVLVLNINENLDLVDEASKSSEYTQQLPNGGLRASQHAANSSQMSHVARITTKAVSSSHGVGGAI